MRREEIAEHITSRRTENPTMAFVSTAIGYSDRSYSSRLDGSEQHSLSIVDSFADVMERICALIL